MIDHATARRLMTDFLRQAMLGHDLDLIIADHQTIERSYGWVFFFNMRAAIESGHTEPSLDGAGPVIVNRADGQLVAYGSAYGIEECLEDYERGFRYRFYVLTIIAVTDAARTVDFLLQLHLTYVVPEVAYGETWMIPRSYTPAQLHVLLQTVPCSFAGLPLAFSWAFWQELRRANCCAFEIWGDADQSTDDRAALVLRYPETSDRREGYA